MKSKIRNYEIQTRLGSGSYGVIFKAINKTNKQQCVLKQIRMNKMSEKAKKSTLNEATIMGKLIHPFIVQYRQSFVEDDTLHIVMEYCDNGDLSMFLKMQNMKALKQQKIWKFFIQICLGLEYIHKNKILHRDIKTLNIFLNKNQDIKIGDLGVAKMLMANDFAQTIVGTPFYLSPELCEEKPYNQKSDIWALGCLLYELCTFKHPFEAANQASLILKIIRGKYSPIPEFYSKQLKDVIDMCLQRDYKRRPTASMILQRSKVRQYIKEFKLEERIKQQYEKLKAIKQNKQPQKSPNIDVPKVPNPVKPVQKKTIQEPVQQKKVQQVNNKVIHVAQNQVRKVSVERKQINESQKKPSISGMPEQKIVLPDKNSIIQKLKPSNIIPSKKQLKPQTPAISHQQSNKKIRQNKEEFLKNLQKVIDHNIQPRRSPIKDRVKGTEEVSTSAVFEQKSRLQKIDMKIQQQLKKQQELQKLKSPNARNKSQTPSLIPPKSQEKAFLGGDRRSVPALIGKDSSKDLGKHHVNQVRHNQNPFMPPLPPKNKQQIIKVKMQQPPVQPKVYESNKSFEQKSKGIIKSRGFTQQLQQDDSNKSHERKISDFKRNSVQNINKPVLFGLDAEQRQKNEQNNKFQKKSSQQAITKSSQYHSQRNIKLIPQIPGTISRIQVKKQPQRYSFKKKSQIPTVNNSINSRVRNKGSSNYHELSRNARNVSKNSEVTKEDEDIVMNLPDSLHGHTDSSDEELSSNQRQIKMNKNFALKDINNSAVLQKYQQILNSKSIGNSQKSIQKEQDEGLDSQNSDEDQKIEQNKKESQAPLKINKNLNQYEEDEDDKHYHPQQKMSDSQFERMLNQPSIMMQKQENQLEFIPQNQSLALKTQQYEDENDEILDQSQEMIDCQQKQIQGDEQDHPNGIEEEIYEVNNFNLNGEKQCDHSRNFQSSHQTYQQQYKTTNSARQSQWSFDQEPQLPMLQDKQSPFFEQANPYLMVQQQQETIQQKKNYLQIRLQQNMKRQDQINKLMQIKIQQCKTVVPKYFDEILQFFRKKINKQDQYSQNDEREVEEFLRKKGLTDQRKFQNIYKIMHFQMELQNTRKIIQRICKKLSQLDNGKDSD